jgi:hypothetical protein
MNQIVLVHELRHAQQDQYQGLDGFLDDDVSDFDDRRLAWTSLLEGDATLVMERFVRLRLGALGVDVGAETDPAALGAPGLFDVPGAPRWSDQPWPYLAGLTFARALWSRGEARHSARREATAAVHRAGPTRRSSSRERSALAPLTEGHAAPGCCRGRAGEMSARW